MTFFNYYLITGSIQVKSGQVTVTHTRKKSSQVKLSCCGASAVISYLQTYSLNCSTSQDKAFPCFINIVSRRQRAFSSCFSIALTQLLNTINDELTAIIIIAN